MATQVASYNVGPVTSKGTRTRRKPSMTKLVPDRLQMMRAWRPMRCTGLRGHESEMAWKPFRFVLNKDVCTCAYVHILSSTSKIGFRMHNVHCDPYTQAPPTASVTRKIYLALIRLSDLLHPSSMTITLAGNVWLLKLE